MERGVAAKRAIVSRAYFRSACRKAEPAKEKREEGGRGHRRNVTVDSSKAKTSLEALKICIKILKWKEFPLGRRMPCDIYWHGVSFHDSEHIFSGQVNKFPGMTDMVRKITLSRAVRVMQELFPEEYNFYPRSWILPEELQFFIGQGMPINTTIIQVCAPTTVAKEEEVDEFYEQVQAEIDRTCKQDILIVMGVWNANDGTKKAAKWLENMTW